MQQKPRVTAKDFFLWLGAMAFLYATVISFIALWFNYINAWFPNPLEYYDAFSSGMRFAIAALIVSFPVYVFITRMLHQDLRKNPEKKELWVRKWLIYLALFVAGVTIAIDLVMLINTYLQGELTARFAWKALGILAVISGSFAYYAYELKGTWERLEKQSKLIGAAVSALVLGSIIGAFFLIGSPETQRLMKLDTQRVSDLQNIQYQVINYWQTKQKLPTAITDLNDPLSGFTAPVDPETGQQYGYRVTTAPYSFELCSDFKTATASTSGNSGNIVSPARPTTPIGVKGVDENWTHAAGQACFERTIDPQRYPPYPKGTVYGAN